MKKQKFSSLVKAFLGSLALFVLMFFLIRIDIYSSLLLAVTGFLLGWLLVRPKPSAARDISLLDASLDQELKDLMLEAQERLAHIQAMSQSVKHRTISEESQNLTRLGEKIMDYLRRNPHKITKARRFFGYYLTTAEDLLKKYAEFERTGIQSQEVEELAQKTADALRTLQDAFRKQYVHLATNEILDMEADIDLLEKTNRTE